MSLRIKTPIPHRVFLGGPHQRTPAAPDRAAPRPAPEHRPTSAPRVPSRGAGASIVVESQEPVAVFDQFTDGLLIFHTIGFDEEIKGGIGFLLGLGRPDVLQISLGLVV